MIPSRHWNSLASINTKKNTGSTEQKQKTKEKTPKQYYTRRTFHVKDYSSIADLKFMRKFQCQGNTQTLTLRNVLNCSNNSKLNHVSRMS